MVSHWISQPSPPSVGASCPLEPSLNMMSAGRPSSSTLQPVSAGHGLQPLGWSGVWPASVFSSCWRKCPATQTGPPVPDPALPPLYLWPWSDGRAQSQNNPPGHRPASAPQRTLETGSTQRCRRPEPTGSVVLNLKETQFYGSETQRFLVGSAFFRFDTALWYSPYQWALVWW